MAVKKITDSQLKTYQDMLTDHGEEGLYRRAVGSGIMRYASNIKNPELELLDISDAFFIANRRDEDQALFTIGKILRRAAHTLYRKLLKEKQGEVNFRFLNVVRQK